ncbi:sulfotransferase 2A1-like [Phascolarctos cinereus]
MGECSAGIHWVIDILSLIYSKGDPTWVESVPYWKCSPWIEIKYCIETIKHLEDPRILTSHLQIHLFPRSFFTRKAKFQFLFQMIYIARNPRDVLVSYYQFQKQVPYYQAWSSFEHFFEEFLRGNAGGSWFDHIKGWLPMRDSKQFLLLFYEEFHQDLKANVEKICQFLGKELSEGEISSVVENASFQVVRRNMIENEEALPSGIPDIFKSIILRKGICGDWKNYFTVTQMETFNKLYQEKMEGLGQGLFPWDQC